MTKGSRNGPPHAVVAVAAPARRAGARPVLWLIALYAISRLAFRAAGVRFDLRPLDTSWQILDPVLLRHDLLESLFYMPGQPPLYNLMLGLVLKTGGNDTVLALLFRCLYSAMALATVLLLAFFGNPVALGQEIVAVLLAF